MVDIQKPVTGVLDLERRVHAYINKRGRHNTTGVRREIDWSQVQLTFAQQPSETFSFKDADVENSSTITVSCKNDSNRTVRQTVVDKGEVRVTRHLSMTTTIHMSGDEKLPLQIPDELAHVGVQMKPATYTGGFDQLHVERSFTSETQFGVNDVTRITSSSKTTTVKYGFLQRTRITGKVTVSYLTDDRKLISIQEIPVMALFNTLDSDFIEDDLVQKCIHKTQGYVEFDIIGNAIFSYDTVLNVVVES